MSHYYLLNFMNLRVLVSDDDLQNIPHPQLEMIAHVTMKNVQAYSLLGALAIAPITCKLQGIEDTNSRQQKAIDFAKTGAKIGLVVGPLMTLVRMYGMRMSNERIYDMAYRVRCNQNAMRIDRLSMIGALAGMGAAHFFGHELSTSALFGLSGGCLFGFLLNVIKV